jgi:hypothetical protein
MSDLTGRKRAPAGLSRWARGVWARLLEENSWGEHEILAFTFALRWWDASDAWLAESAATTGRDKAALVKQALDAATTALRYWRTLRFTDPATPSRRPGRPSGENWSAARQEAARVARLEPGRPHASR